MDFRAFPFDKQFCDINLYIPGYDKSDGKFRNQATGPQSAHQWASRTLNWPQRPTLELGGRWCLFLPTLIFKLNWYGILYQYFIQMQKLN